MSNGDWFDTGASAVDRALQKNKGNKLSFRFYVKPGADAVILFCDGDNTAEEPIGNYKEHSYETKDGKWPNFCSCVGVARKCAFCERGLKPYDAWPFTIIQLRPTWKDREGKEHENEKKLLVAKKEAMQRILRHLNQRKGLTGTIWSIFRSGQKAYTIGDDWQFSRKIGGDGLTLAQRRLEMAKPFQIEYGQTTDGKPGIVQVQIPLDALAPVNYREILNPKTYEELVQEGADFDATKRREQSWSNKGGGKVGGVEPPDPKGRSASVPY